MSNPNNARRVQLEVAFEGADITSSIRPFLKSCSYTESEDGADDFQLVLHDRDNPWLKNWLPQIIEAAPGFTMQGIVIQRNWRGDGRDRMLDFGKHRFDEALHKGPPDEVILKSVAIPHGKGIQQTPKTRVFESIDLRSIAEDIARDGGMSLFFESAANPHYGRIEQDDISDLVFLQNLCRDAGASLKVTDNFIVIIGGTSFAERPAVATIRKNDGSYTKHSLRFSTEEGKKVWEASFTMVGNTDLLSAMPANVTGFGAWDGSYAIKSTQHNIGNGYTTQIELRR